MINCPLGCPISQQNWTVCPLIGHWCLLRWTKNNKLPSWLPQKWTRHDKLPSILSYKLTTSDCVLAKVTSDGTKFGQVSSKCTKCDNGSLGCPISGQNLTARWPLSGQDSKCPLSEQNIYFPWRLSFSGQSKIKHPLGCDIVEKFDSVLSKVPYTWA